MNIGMALRECAMEHGLRQADICKETGMSSALVSMMFNGRAKDPSAENVWKVTNAIGITFDELMDVANQYDDDGERMMITKRELGRRIANARRMAGMTQEELAKRCGVHSMTVSKWERGTMCPSALELLAISDATETSPDLLLGYER